MKNLRLNQKSFLLTALFFCMLLTTQAQIHSPTASVPNKKTESKTETVSSTEYVFTSTFNKKSNYKVEKMLSKKLGKRSGFSNKLQRVWYRLGNKKVEGLEVIVSEGELSLKYKKSANDAEVREKIKELLVDLTTLVQANDKEFKMKVEGKL